MTTDPETPPARALLVEALMNARCPLEGEHHTSAFADLMAETDAGAELLRRADEARVAEGLCGFEDEGAMCGKVLGDIVHLRRDHDVCGSIECHRYLPAPRPPEPVAESQVQPPTVAEVTAIGNSRPPEPDRTAALAEEARLVSQWADAVDHMPMELRGELADLGDHARAILAATPEPAPVADGTVEG